VAKVDERNPVSGKKKPGFYFNLGWVAKVDERNPVSGGWVAKVD
jgi:hypothetical protein